MSSQVRANVLERLRSILWAGSTIEDTARELYDKIESNPDLPLGPDDVAVLNDVDEAIIKARIQFRLFSSRVVYR